MEKKKHEFHIFIYGSLLPDQEASSLLPLDHLENESKFVMKNVKIGVFSQTPKGGSLEPADFPGIISFKNGKSKITGKVFTLALD